MSAIGWGSALPAPAGAVRGSGLADPRGWRPVSLPGVPRAREFWPVAARASPGRSASPDASGRGAHNPSDPTLASDHGERGHMPGRSIHDAFEDGLKPLWQRAQAGDEGAYRDALGCIAARLRGFFRRRMQAVPDEVEDLVQETLLALHLHRGTHDPAMPVSAWIFAIAGHKLVDAWRRRGRHDARLVPLDDVDEEVLVSADHDAQAQRDLGRLLAQLPQAQRTAIHLTKLEGLSVAEASAKTGASESAIKVQVHRGLKRLAAVVKVSG